MEYLLFIIAGCFAGLMAGFLGIGGGMVVVPALHFIFSHHADIAPESVMHIASGTSLCTMIFTSQSSVLGHYRHGNILWSLYYKIVPLLVVGVVVGALVADVLSTGMIKKIFAFFLLFVAIEMLLSSRVAIRKTKKPDWLTRVISLFVGMVSGLLGIGGGTLLIPYLSRCRVATRKIVAVSSLSSLTVATVGTVAVILTGLNENYNAPWSTGFVYWPAVMMIAIPSMISAQFASRWMYRVRPSHLKRFFIVFLLITSVTMLFK